jgi:hypothetical protein
MLVGASRKQALNDVEQLHSIRGPKLTQERTCA